MVMSRSEAGKLGRAVAKEKLEALSKERSKRVLEEFKKRDLRCLLCGKPIPFERRNNKFCSHSCAATHTNVLRGGKIREKAPCPICGGKAVKNGTFCNKCIEDGRHLHRLPLEELKIDSSRRRYILRTREHVCAICGIAEWNGEETPLVMDHINGNPTLNTEENLRLVCPNCDAQLPTYKGRNKGKGRVSRRQRYAEGKSF